MGQRSGRSIKKDQTARSINIVLNINNLVHKKKKKTMGLVFSWVLQWYVFKFPWNVFDSEKRKIEPTRREKNQALKLTYPQIQKKKKKKKKNMLVLKLLIKV